MYVSINLILVSSIAVSCWAAIESLQEDRLGSGRHILEGYKAVQAQKLSMDFPQEQEGWQMVIKTIAFKWRGWWLQKLIKQVSNVFWKLICFLLEARHLSGELIICFYINLPPDSQNKTDTYILLGNRKWFNIWTKRHWLKKVWWA